MDDNTKRILNGEDPRAFIEGASGAGLSPGLIRLLQDLQIYQHQIEQHLADVSGGFKGLKWVDPRIEKVGQHIQSAIELIKSIARSPIPHPET